VVKKMERRVTCGASRTEDGLGLHCSRCDKIVGDVQADLMADFGVRDNVV